MPLIPTLVVSALTMLFGTIMVVVAFVIWLFNRHANLAEAMSSFGLQAITFAPMAFFAYNVLAASLNETLTQLGFPDNTTQTLGPTFGIGAVPLFYALIYASIKIGSDFIKSAKSLFAK